MLGVCISNTRDIKEVKNGSKWANHPSVIVAVKILIIRYFHHLGILIINILMTMLTKNQRLELLF